MKYKLVVGQNVIKVDTAKGSLTSDFKQGCAQPPENCIWCAAIDGLESLVLAHAMAGIDIGSEVYQEGIQTALDAIANHLGCD